MQSSVLNRFLLLASGRSDLVLASLLVSVIFMMIIPLPTGLIDALIAANIGMAVVLLMVAMYIQTPLAFAAFPSVLLITTLFRLALSISTTRLILLQADAGQIILTFGNFVVGGNLIVGIVVFLIITIVQFVVITKGAERVAEVGARFTLDAMPGKQMSIDGDMRAGLIDAEQARHRRAMVEKESQLYGSMDGAMKFVKGDAIANLIIIAVNLIGGIAIGTLQRGLTAGEAMQIYSILTIGDGLVAQIPGLFIAITAGVIVTRVSSENPTNLGTDITTQIAAQPNSLLVGSAILVGFSAVPGMPTVTFLALAALVGTFGFFRMRQAKRELANAEQSGRAPAMTPMVPQGKPKSSVATRPEEEFALTVPLMLDVAAELQNSLRPEALNEELIKIRRALYFDLGVPFPGIHLRFNEGLDDGHYNITMQEIPISQGRLRPGYVLARESTENLDILGIPYETDKPFLPKIQTLWVAASHQRTLQTTGIPIFEPPQILAYHLSFLLKKYAEDFIGLQETRFLLTNMEDQYPELVKEVQRILSVQKITEVFQRLVSEEISIRNLRTMLQSLIEWGQKEKDVVVLTEYVRISVKRYISYKYSAGQNILPAYLLTPDVEDEVRNAIRQTSAGSYLALDPNKSHRLVSNIKEAVGDMSQHAQRPVLLTSMDIRRYLRKLIELEIYELPVLSYQELTQEVTIQPLSRISL